MLPNSLCSSRQDLLHIYLLRHQNVSARSFYLILCVDIYFNYLRSIYLVYIWCNVIMHTSQELRYNVDQISTHDRHTILYSHVLHLAVSDNKVFGLKPNHHDCLVLMRNAIILIQMYKQACRMYQNRIITSMGLWWRVDVSHDFVTRGTAKRADCLKIAPTLSSCGLHALVSV